ncbi:MAG: hypothetical protein IRZ16_15835 [Myxococcaceae bacterium]|nr:hypothetical protein [Myxococcaceae bacterium]
MDFVGWILSALITFLITWPFEYRKLKAARRLQNDPWVTLAARWEVVLRTRPPLREARVRNIWGSSIRRYRWLAKVPAPALARFAPMSFFAYRLDELVFKPPPPIGAPELDAHFAIDVSGDDFRRRLLESPALRRALVRLFSIGPSDVHVDRGGMVRVLVARRRDDLQEQIWVLVAAVEVAGALEQAFAEAPPGPTDSAAVA